MSTFGLSVLPMRVDDSILNWGDIHGDTPLCSTMKSLSNDNISVYIEPLIKMQILAGHGDGNYTDGAIREP